MFSRRPRRDAQRQDGVARTAPRAAGLPTPPEENIDAYLVDIIHQLEGIARSQNKPMLAYFLSMAAAQAISPVSSHEDSYRLH